MAVKHTGAQSLITNTLNLVGGLARIFTTLNETGDMTVVMGFLLSVALNATIFAQYWVYKANTEKFLAELKAERKEEDTKKKQ
jgi:mannose-P-dolichol utilization defect protein 1